MSRPADWWIVKVLGRQKYLCLSLIAFMLTGPIVGHLKGPVASLVMYGILTLVFITGPLTASRSRTELIATALFAAMTLSTGVFSTLYFEVAPFTTLMGVVFFAYLTYLLGRQLLHIDTRVDAETLWMSVNVFILAGLFFAFLYGFVAYIQPNAFVGKFMDSALQDQLYGFVYFSFVTLTTLGYGDLTPNTVMIATITYMEALFGQLYVAILIASLVGLYASSRNDPG